MKFYTHHYKLARLVFSLGTFLWFNLLRRGILYDKVNVVNYRGFCIDVLYVVRFK
jgi:hypothetical protein